MLQLVFILIWTVTIQIGEYEFCDDANGRYYNASEVIQICSSADNMIYVLSHELGHHYRYEYLSEEEREEYQSIANEYSWAMTKYWNTNIKEDFAETFAMWLYKYHKKLYRLWEGTDARFELLYKYTALSSTSP